MQKGSKNKIFNAIKLILIVLIASTLVLSLFRPNKTVAAGEVTLTVNKISTVSVYASGPGVTLIRSNNNEDVYEIDSTNNQVTLYAVNESRLFNGWTIKQTADGDEVNTAGAGSVYSLSVTESLEVSVKRKDATVDDYGSYILDRYIINDENDLIALQDIVAGNGGNEDFAEFYEDATVYNTDAKKAALRTKFTNGYFVISHNFIVYNKAFVGIGTKDNPFKGVMCGMNNNVESTIFLTISQEETNNETSYGLFKYLGENAVVRNLNVVSTIGITKANNNRTGVLYAGGLAGHMEKCLLANVSVESKMGIEVSQKDVYVGGIAGYIASGAGFDSVGNVRYNGENTSWTVQSSNGNLIYAGMVAGYAQNTYVKDLTINVTNSVIDLKSDKITNNNYSNAIQVALGNLYGYYNNTSSTAIDNVQIIGSSGQILRTVVNGGDSFVGGLIGYANASSTLNIVNVDFNVLGSKNQYLSTSANTSSKTNLYTGGIIGYVNGNNCIATGAMKNGISTIQVDGEDRKVFNYIFEGEYEVKSLQNGTSSNVNHGKAIAGGFVGKGYIDIEGTQDLRSSIVFASPTSKLTVDATQSKLTDTTGTLNDKEHACAGLIFGSVGDTNLNVSYIDVYSNNTTIQTVREIGSKAMGDLHTGGFIGYVNKSTLDNISILLNNSNISVNSLSYEGDAKNSNTDTNSAFCGGIVGQATNNSTLSNLVVAGFDTTTAEVVGTTLKMESIQNTVPGGGDYKGENYIGGIVGRVQYVKIDNCKYIGSEGSEDYIKMNGHESPDSAFCGGIVGMIRTATNGVPSSVTNCEISNAYVYAAATNSTNYNNPDIYVGGIIGAAYMHATDIVLNVSNCSVSDTDVYGLGNDYIAVYSGGIMGGATWEDTCTISDCYVTRGSIIANLVASSGVSYNNDIESAAGGIIGMKGGTGITVSNSAVIDVNVDATTNYIGTTYNTRLSSYAAGIGAYRESGSYTINNCYTNAIVNSLAILNSTNQQGNYDHIYAIAIEATINVNSSSITSITYGGNTYNITWNGNECYFSRRSGYSTYYIRVNNGAITTSTDNSQRAIFTLEAGYLRYGNYYLVNNGSLTQNKQNATKFISGSRNTYYLDKNISEASTTGEAVPSTGFASVTGTAINIYSEINYLNDEDGYGNKLIFITNSPYFETNRSNNSVSTIRCNDMSTYHAAMVDVWINRKNGGDTTTFDVSPEEYYGSMEAANAAGWFKFDSVIVDNGVNSNINSSDIESIDSDYLNISNVVYEYSSSSADSSIVQNINNLQDYIENRYFESINNNNYKYRLRVYDDMLSLKLNIKFTVVADYNIVISNNVNLSNPIDISTASATYGNITFTGKGQDYVLTLKANELIESDYTFYIGFRIGDTGVYTSKKIEIELIHNEISIVGVTFADYTPPHNYYDNDENLGKTSDNPYELSINSITKFIPVITKSNDINEGKTYALEQYIERYNYTITNDVNNQSIGTIYSSGELKASDTANRKGRLTLTDKINGKTATVYIETATYYTVTYNITGSDVSGLTYATPNTDFYFEQISRSNYSGVPDSFTIRVGNTNHTITQPNSNANVKVYEVYADGSRTANPITEWDADAYGYIIYVDKSLVTNNITINITYPVVYTLLFNLQCETFNSAYGMGLTKSFKVKTGTTYNAFFDAETKKELDDWAKGAKIFGYEFKGFYLVDSANSIDTYGLSLEQLISSSSTVSASTTFYARWTFLIELVEAPGTRIKSSFPSTFMEQHYVEDEFNRSIEIPINANQGYIFTIEKDSDFEGEASVTAYSVKKEGDEEIITEITIEKYHDNMYLYYIPPELINGYLVIVTSVSNSEIIVGENSFSVTEEILPEDGIRTFKYIINHTYKPNSDPKLSEVSFIYNTGRDIDGDGDLNDDKNYNLTLNKNFVLKFFEEIKGADGIISKIERHLAIGTYVEVHYSVCYDSDTSTTKHIVAAYKVTEEVKQVSLDDFKLLDLETKAFTNVTFGEFLGSHNHVSETYYFVITPPNGCFEHIQDEIKSYIIEGGYIDENNGEYVSGVRSAHELANKEFDDKIKDDLVEEFLKESSKASRTYGVTPSRVTILEDKGDHYTFTDDQNFHVYDIKLINTDITNGYIRLFDDTTQSIIESDTLKFGISKLILSLGYGLGEVRVEGYDGTKWNIIEEINVNSALYSNYEIVFNGNTYTKFRIDNISSTEIRLNKLDVVSRSNNYIYEANMNNFVLKESQVTNYSYDGNIRNFSLDSGEVYSVIQSVVGDARHDSKSFILAVQFTENGNIVEDIRGSVHVLANGETFECLNNQTGNINYGKNVAYIDLTYIINHFNVSKFDFEIIFPDGYVIKSIHLIEAESVYKPAMGEVRYQITK